MENFTPRQITEDKRVELREKFFEIKSVHPQEDQAWQQMHDFFKDRPAELDHEYYNSFFLWYSIISWKRLNKKYKKFVTDIAVPRQILLAYMSQIDVWDRFMYYLEFQVIDRDEIKSVYKDAKENFLNSNSVVGKEDGENVTISDLVTDFKKIQTKRDQSLAAAKFHTRLREIITNHETDWYKFDNYGRHSVEEIAHEFYKLCDFFTKVGTDRIDKISFGYFYPNLQKLPRTVGDIVQEKRVEGESGYGNNTRDEEEQAESSPQESGYVTQRIRQQEEKQQEKSTQPSDGAQSNNKQEDTATQRETKNETETIQTGSKSSQEKNKETSEDKKTQSTTQENQQKKTTQNQTSSEMSYKEIKQEVEKQFGPIEQLDPAHITNFKKVLQSIAKQQDREDEVDDWYYFDSSSSVFKWNEDLFGDN